ncbi:hypothetical protein MRX96_053718 [Rhipicephalus microplus]
MDTSSLCIPASEFGQRCEPWLRKRRTERARGLRICAFGANSERLRRPPDAGLLLTWLGAVANAGVGQLLGVYDGAVADDTERPSCWPPPHRAMTQEAAARMYGDLAGRTQVFTDESILRDGFAGAACLSPQLDTDRQCRLWYCASSTTAELFGVLLAADLLRKSPAIKSAAIFCDSKPAPKVHYRRPEGWKSNSNGTVSSISAGRSSSGDS